MKLMFFQYFKCPETINLQRSSEVSFKLEVNEYFQFNEFGIYIKLCCFIILFFYVFHTCCLRKYTVVFKKLFNSQNINK